MKKGMLYLIGLVVLSLICYKLTIKYLPNVIYSRAKTKMITKRQIKENELQTLPFPTSDNRAVVKPNPDFAYASTFYDLSDGPIHLTGPMPDSTYWSLALYEPNTNNFYVKNDMQFGTDQLNVVIASASQKEVSEANAEVITSPTEKGFMLVRILGTTRSESERKEMIDLMDQLEVREVE